MKEEAVLVEGLKSVYRKKKDMEEIVSKEDLDYIEYAFSLINRARYPDFNKVDELHRRLLHSNVRPTNCGSCMRIRVCDLKGWKDQYTAKVEAEMK